MKVAFLFSASKPDYLLSVYRKMTPEQSGKWKSMEGVHNLDLADFVVVIDSTVIPIPKNKKVVYVGAHPTCVPSYECFDGKECVAKFDLKDTFGFGEWWIDYDYDYLSRLKLPRKEKKLCCIISDSRTRSFHLKRIEFLKKFCERGIFWINCYGRLKNEPLSGRFLRELGVNTPDNYWAGKEVVLKEHRWSLEFDAAPCENYFSERFFDAMLLWAKPIYWGGSNIEKYLPKESFKYLDIEGNGDDIIEEIKSENINYEAIAEARNLLLNKYQIWPRIYEVIKDL